MEVFFYLMVLLAIIGWVLGRKTVNAKLFYNHVDYESYIAETTRKRIWIGVKQPVSRAVKVKVRFLGNPALELAKDIEIVTNRNTLAESYSGYTYREILESMTPEQIKAVNEIRSFLK